MSFYKGMEMLFCKSMTDSRRIKNKYREDEITVIQDTPKTNFNGLGFFMKTSYVKRFFITILCTNINNLGENF